MILKNIKTTTKPLIIANILGSSGEFLNIIICLLFSPKYQSMFTYQYRANFVLTALLTSITIATSIRSYKYFSDQKKYQYTLELARHKKLCCYIAIISTGIMILLTWLYILTANIQEMSISVIWEYAILYILAGIITCFSQTAYLDLLARKKANTVKKISFHAFFINLFLSLLLSYYLGVIGIAIGFLISRFYSCVSLNKEKKVSLKNIKNIPNFISDKSYIHDSINTLSTLIIGVVTTIIIYIPISKDIVNAKIYGLTIAISAAFNGIFLAIGTGISTNFYSLLKLNIQSRQVEKKQTDLWIMKFSILLAFTAFLLFLTAGIKNNIAPINIILSIGILFFLTNIINNFSTTQSKGYIRTSGHTLFNLKMSLIMSILRIIIIIPAYIFLNGYIFLISFYTISFIPSLIYFININKKTINILNTNQVI